MSKRETVESGPYTPFTGAPCSCRPGIERDNCPQCEGTGKRIDFQAIHARRKAEESGKAPGWLADELGPATAGAIVRALDNPRPTPKNPQGPQPGGGEAYAARIKERLGTEVVTELRQHLPPGTMIWSCDVHTTRSGVSYYWLRAFAASPDRWTAPAASSDNWGGTEAVMADRDFYIGKDVALALGATFKQAQYWQGWHGDLHPARAVALLGEVLYGTPDAFGHRSLG